VERAGHAAPLDLKYPPREKKSETVDLIWYRRGTTRSASKKNPLTLSLRLRCVAVHGGRVTSVRRTNRRRRGVDLTVWMDEVSPVFRNPILVEVKTTLSGVDRWAQARDQLYEFLTATTATCGLLVSNGPAAA